MEIHENIKLIVGQVIPFLPCLDVLGDLSCLKGISEPKARCIHTATMLHLISEWKSVNLLPSCLWFTQLSIVAAYEELTYMMVNQLDLYHVKFISLITGL